MLATAGIMLKGHMPLPSHRKDLAERIRAGFPDKPIPDLRQWIVPVAFVGPMKEGDVILTVPKSEVEDGMNLQLDVSLDEPQIIQSKPIADTIERFAHIVRSIVLGLRTYL